jgi:hypothetical protein
MQTDRSPSLRRGFLLPSSFFARSVLQALLVVTLAISSLVIRPASGHAQTIQPRPTGQRNAVTVQTRAQTSVQRFDTFMRGPGGMLWHRFWENYTWYDWQSLNVFTDSAPAAIAVNSSSEPNTIYVYYLRSGAINYMVLDASFSTTQIVRLGSLGKAPYYVVHPGCQGDYACGYVDFVSAPAVSTWPGGHQDVFVLAEDMHHLLHTNRTTTNRGQTLWDLVSVANFAGDPAAVSWGPNRIDLFIQDSDGKSLVHKVYDGSWHSWEDLGGTILYSPAVASMAAGRLDVFVIGTDHQLWTKVFDNGQWSDWGPLGGLFISSPGAGSLGQGQLDVAGVGYDFQVYLSWWGGQWSPWVGIGITGDTHSAPAVVDSWVTP